MAKKGTTAATRATHTVSTPPARPSQDPVEALQHLLDTGVLTQEEFDELWERVER